MMERRSSGMYAPNQTLYFITISIPEKSNPIFLHQIWEGKPVQIYETGHFKLVDGKFSP